MNRQIVGGQQKKEQANNRRTNINITYKGKTKTLTQWCEIYNMKYGNVLDAINKKWDFSLIIKTFSSHGNRGNIFKG
jgi:hypothetical protein